MHAMDVKRPMRYTEYHGRMTASPVDVARSRGMAHPHRQEAAAAGLLRLPRQVVVAKAAAAVTAEAYASRKPLDCTKDIGPMSASPSKLVPLDLPRAGASRYAHRVTQEEHRR